MKNIIVLCLLLWGFSQSANAGCNRENDNEADILLAPPPSLVLENRSYQPGEILWQSGWSSPAPNVTIRGCGNNYVVGFLYEPGTPQATANQITVANDGDSTAVFPTSVAGIGVAVKTHTNAGPYDNVMSINNTYMPGDGRSNHTAKGASYSLALVATGEPISDGTVTLPSPLARVSFRESANESAAGDVLTKLLVGNTNIVIKALGCTVDSTALILNLGTVDVGEFNDNIWVGNASQPLTLTCEPGTAVNASLSAIPASGENAENSVIALTDADAATTAKGIGVQFGLQVSSSGFITDAMTIGQTIPLFSHTIDHDASGSAIITGGTQQTEALTLTARYFKTGTVVSPGLANSTATLTLSYN